ncbi:metalloprotease [Colletotrichum higginsianum]|nr:metalloprotease [Colletotrichum higginsianum]
MSSTSKRPFLFCGTDGLQAGSYDAPSGSRIENEGAPSHLAVNRSKCWPAGKKIHVRFLDGSLEIQQRVRHWTQSWEEFANIDFKFMADDEQGHADIRVDFQFVRDLGTWSYIGRDAEVGVIEQKHPTMDFGELNGNSPESEVSHSVLHEFGHAIGCVHEHQANPIKWDRAQVIADCKARYKWNEATTRQQILNL